MPENPLRPLEECDPKLMELVQKGRDFALADGAIPAKYKLLMAMILDAAEGASDGVGTLARRAMQAGATREEVGEALRVAHYICGVGSTYTACRGLRDVFPGK